MDAITDVNNPVCTNTCPTNSYIDVDSPGLIYCVESCKTLEPTSYIFIDTEDVNKKKCKRKCPDSVPAYWWIKTDLDKPINVLQCMSRSFISIVTIMTLTTKGVKYGSLKNLHICFLTSYNIFICNSSVSLL